MNNTLSTKSRHTRWTSSLIIAATLPLLPSALQAVEWTSITDSLQKRATAQDEKEIWPGGCAGVVTNRLTGDVTVKVVGHGLWQSTDQGKTWARQDKKVISGRDETGWATNLDQNSPTKMASFSLDGTAGWTTDGTAWKKFADLGRNWDYGSVDWGTKNPKVIIAVKHETNPPGEIYATNDGGASWNQLPIHVLEDRDKPSMVGALGGNALIYGKGDGIHRSSDLGKTWTEVSKANPLTRVPVFFKGVHYLGTAKGLLVSKDKGTSWQEQGSPVDIWQGPFFGRDQKEMLVVGESGIHQTKDAGATWRRVADLKPNAGGFKFTPGWFGCYAWDPVNQIVYASSMGNPVFKLALEK